MDKLEDLFKRAEEGGPYGLDCMGIHYGNGCPIELRKKIYNQAIDDVIKELGNDYWNIAAIKQLKK